MSYIFHLKDQNTTRMALYNPATSELFWQDSNESLIDQHPAIFAKCEVISPEHPGKKTKQLTKIKIQMGFACNYSCTYCSQNNQREKANDTPNLAVLKVDAFFAKMPLWFDGGEKGNGEGVHLEFWGGETLLYWKAISKLAGKIRERYPEIELALFTNGSLISESMIEEALKLKIHFVVSHDGPTFNQDRAKDPFDIPEQSVNLKKLFDTLNPHGLVSFNATISPKNFSFLKIREYIAAKLGVPPRSVSLSHDLATPYDQAGLSYVTEPQKREQLIGNLFVGFKAQFPHDMNAGRLALIIQDFFHSLEGQRPSDSVGQKCEMDKPSSIAVDLDGNILTCQNVTATGGHKIGEVENLSDAALTTAWHWGKRKECIACPVVQICKGSCMFLTGDLWQASCEQYFTWSLAYLSFALYLQTGRFLTKIEGTDIRNKAGVTFINVLNGQELS